MSPSVIKVEVKEGYQVYIEFDNNECGVLNIEPYLEFGVFIVSQLKFELNSFHLTISPWARYAATISRSPATHP